MLTSTSGVFEQFKNNIGTDTTMIVELTDGVTTWYFSTMDMHLAEGHVHALVKGSISISESVDVFSKKWNVGGVTFKLTNEPYRKDSSGADVRVADDLADIRGSEAKIHLVAGPNITSLSDAITRFVGTVITAPSYDGKTLTIRLVDKGKLANIKLPQNNIDSIYSEAPTKTKDKNIPIAYGEFTYESETSLGFGLAVAVVTQNAEIVNAIISGHVLDSITGVYAKVPVLPVPSLFASPTTNVNDSGNGTVILAKDEVANTRIPPIDNFAGDYSTAQDANHVTNHDHAYDGRADTFAALLDFVDTGAGVSDYVLGNILFAFDDYSRGESYNNDIGTVIASPGDPPKIEIIAEAAAPGVGLDYATIDVHHNVGPPDAIVTVGQLDGGDLSTKTKQIFPLPFPPNAHHWAWQLRSKVIPDTNGDREPLLFRVYAQTSGDASSDPVPDGVTLNQTIMKIYDFRYVIEHTVKDPSTIFIDCMGREYGSWITSRSSSYANGDAIEDPAGIIESILRDELGVATADIDLTTFIDAENTSMKARMNLHSDNEKTSTEAIREICEQATFAFVWGANGTAKLLPLNDSSPTTNRIIPFSHVKEGSLKVSKTKETEIVNHITVKSRWQQEIEEYRDNDIVENATSQSAFGTFKMESTWANIAGTSVDHMTSHLVNDADAILANDHVIITFDAEGFTNADLEIGDWIELDDATFDTHQLCYGGSWSGKQFLITATKAQMKTTTITAVELY